MRPNGLNIVHLWPIALAVALALQLGCTTIGQYKVAPETDLEQANSPTPVVIIVLDGLNQNTLSDYLGQLESNAFSPPWLSGLALLARDQFKLGYTSRGGTVIPSSRHASVAALATGTYPDKNGIVGDGFLVRKAMGTSRRLELNRPTHGLSVWRTDAGLRPTSTKPSGLHELLQAKTWLSELATTYRTETLYFPYGHGTHWSIPSNERGGTLAILDHAAATQAVPLLDKAVGLALKRTLIRGPSVVISHFRSIAAASCLRDNVTCEGAKSSLKHQQERALRMIDMLLHRAFKQYSQANSDQYKNTLFIVVGTSGLLDRSLDGLRNSTHILDRERLLDQLGTHIAPACIPWFVKSREHNDISMALDGSVARLYLPQCRLGNCDERQRAMQCLSPALEQMAITTQWLAGVAWDPWVGTPYRPIAQRLKTIYRKSFWINLTAHQRARLDAKVRRSISTTSGGRSGDVVLFSSGPWIFREASHTELGTYARTGGFNAKMMRIPIMFMDRRLSDAAVRSLHSAPLEITDIAPTVLSLLGVPHERYERPPAIQWRTGDKEHLEFAPAERSIRRPSVPKETTFFSETAGNSITLGIREAGTHWPPDAVELTLAKTKYSWDPDAAKFDPSAPCTYTSSRAERLWQCTFPKPGQPGEYQARAMRAPNPTSDGNFVSEHIVYVKPSAPTIHRIRPICASSKTLEIELETSDAIGLQTLHASFTSRDSATKTESLMPIAAAVQNASKTCDAATKQHCPPDVPFRAHKKKTAQYRFALKSAWLDRIEDGSALLESTVTDRLRAQEKFKALSSADDSPSPKLAWITLTVCNRAGKCTSQPILTDSEYRMMLTTQCLTPKNE